MIAFVGERYFGLDTDVKPTNAIDGSIFFEYNTYNEFYCINGVWIQNNKFIRNEIPNGIVNSVNKIFTPQNNYMKDTLCVYLNGLRQREGCDYNMNGNSIVFIDEPYGDLTYKEVVTVDYMKI